MLSYACLTRFGGGFEVSDNTETYADMAIKCYIYIYIYTASYRGRIVVVSWSYRG